MWLRYGVPEESPEIAWQKTVTEAVFCQVLSLWDLGVRELFLPKKFEILA